MPGTVLLKPVAALWCAIILVVLPALPARAGTLDAILASGEIVVGVKEDYEPFGYRDRTGALTGLEIDIAREIARQLDVSLRLEVVSSSDRLQNWPRARLTCWSQRWAIRWTGGAS